MDVLAELSKQAKDKNNPLEVLTVLKLLTDEKVNFGQHLVYKTYQRLTKSQIGPLRTLHILQMFGSGIVDLGNQYFADFCGTEQRSPTRMLLTLGDGRYVCFMPGSGGWYDLDDCSWVPTRSIPQMVEVVSYSVSAIAEEAAKQLNSK